MKMRITILSFILIASCGIAQAATEQIPSIFYDRTINGTEAMGMVIDVHGTITITNIEVDGSVTANRVVIRDALSSSTILDSSSITASNATFDFDATNGNRYIIEADSSGSSFDTRSQNSCGAVCSFPIDTGSIYWLSGEQYNSGGGNWENRTDAPNIYVITFSSTSEEGEGTTSTTSQVMQEAFFGLGFLILGLLLFLGVMFVVFKLISR